jgi:hypothetical protein
VYRAERFLDREVAIGPVRNHLLARLETELRAIELDRDFVRLERHQVGDAADLRIGVGIRPSRQTCIIDGVIAAEPFVWAEGLELHRREGRLVDVDAGDVPTRRESGLVEGERPRRIRNDAVMWRTMR